MDALQAFILGLIQGLTEFLPVSSDGHLQIGSSMMGLHNPEQNLGFTILVHVATVCASIVIFRKDIFSLLKGCLEFKMNESTTYVLKLILSAIPVIIVGLFFIKEIEKLFEGNLTLTGGGLIVTALLLFMTVMVKPKEKEVSYVTAFMMGIAQALAVLPGLSRSGSTVATALVFGVNKEKAIRFSFLMLILPVMGKATLDVKDLLFPDSLQQLGIASAEPIGTTPLVIAFLTSFFVGLLACKLMLSIVKKGKIHYFAYYCLVAGTISLLFGLNVL